MAKRIKWLRLTAKHLKSARRKAVRVRIPVPALGKGGTFRAPATYAVTFCPSSVRVVSGCRRRTTVRPRRLRVAT